MGCSYCWGKQMVWFLDHVWPHPVMRRMVPSWFTLVPNSFSLVPSSFSFVPTRFTTVPNTLAPASTSRIHVRN